MVNLLRSSKDVDLPHVFWRKLSVGEMMRREQWKCYSKVLMICQY